MRFAAALMAWWMLIALASAQSVALILIQPGVAMEPGAPRETPLWVLWPREVFPSSHSALLSLVTGEDWLGDRQDSVFTTLPDGKLRSATGSLAARGYFQARSSYMGSWETYALAGAQGSFHETTLLLALEAAGRPIRVLRRSSTWPATGLVVYEASSWRDADEVGQYVTRSIVLEYPPPAGATWTRCWMVGRGWPEGRPEPKMGSIRDLISAKNVLSAIAPKPGFRWVTESAPIGPKTPELLEMIRSEAGVWRTEFGILLGCVVCSGLVLALRERRAVGLAEVCQALLLVPAASVVGGSLARPFGVSAIGPVIAISFVGLVVVAKIGQWLVSFWVPDAHRLAAPALISLVAFSSMDSTWSPLSGVLSQSEFPADMFGCWFASLVAACAFAKGSSLALEWALRLFAVGSALLFGMRVWWEPSLFPFAFLPVVALAVGEGFWRWAAAPVLPILGALKTPGLMNGVAWKPGGLLERASDASKLEGSAYVSFFLSPLFVGVCGLVFVFSLVADRFLLYQYRRLVADDPRRIAVLIGTGALGLVGLTQPALLTSALWCAVAGLTIVVLEGLTVL